MKRERASERAAITARPRRMSSSRSAGRAFRASRLSRLPAIDLIGASELLSSWPRTRIRRCQACRSSSRRARLTLARTSRRWGSPPWRKVLPRASKRPVPPGRARSSTPGSPAAPAGSAAPSGSPRPSSSALRPSSCSAGRSSSRSPARFTRRRRRSSSKANTATSISSMTLRRRAVASRAPRRCWRRVSASAFTSCIAWESASSPFEPRARNEKSSSRNAATRFERVCRGRMTFSCTEKAKASQTPITRSPSVHCTLPLKSAAQSRPRVATAPGSPARSANRRTRRSWESFRRRLEAMALQAPVERAARQAEGLRGPAHVPVETGERLLDEEALDLFEAHVVEARLPFPPGPEPEVLGLHLGAVGHEHRPLDRVVELPHVPRPGVLGEASHGRGLEAGDALSIALGVLAEEVGGEEGNVLPPLAQGRDPDLDGVQAEEQVLAEARRRHLGVQVGVGGGQDAHVDPARLGGAYPVGLGVGERALHVAEELALENALGEASRVHGGERARGAQGDGVEGAGHRPLAGPVLAGDEHVGVGGADARDEPDLALLAQEAHLGLQPLAPAQGLPQLDLGADDREQPRVLPGLLDEIAGPPAHGL